VSNRVLVLLSGGLDSVTCLAMAVADPTVDHVLALTFDYGQSNAPEIDKARQLCANWRVPHVVRALPMAASDAHKEIPARNLIFLSHALALAIEQGYHTIYIGAEPDAVYTDSSVEFVAKVNALADMFGVSVVAPIKHLADKVEVLTRALNLGVPLHLCHSSLSAAVDGQCKTSLRFLAAIQKLFPVGYQARDILSMLGTLHTTRSPHSYRIGYGREFSFKVPAAVFTLAQPIEDSPDATHIYSTGSWMEAMRHANANRTPQLNLCYLKTDVLVRLLRQTYNCDNPHAQWGIMQALSELPRPRYAPRLACRVVQGHLAHAARTLGYTVVSPRDEHDILLDTSTPAR
jgi:7-cyano-7-deazaguanine synthase